MRWWAEYRLRTRIFLSFSALILGALVLTLGLTQLTLSRQTQKTLKDQLVVTGQVFQRLIKRGEFADSSIHG